MVPDTSRWETARHYDFMDHLGGGDLAWECLRRNSRYQTDFSRLIGAGQTIGPLPEAISQRWGLRFRRPAKPQQH